MFFPMVIGILGVAMVVVGLMGNYYAKREKGINFHVILVSYIFIALGAYVALYSLCMQLSGSFW